MRERSGRVVHSVDRSLRLALRHVKDAKRLCELGAPNSGTAILDDVIADLRLMGAKESRKGVKVHRQVNC